MKADAKDFAFFTDASASPDLRIGVGAYVKVPVSCLEVSSKVIARPQLTALLKLRRFENTSPARLELQTVLWALEENRQGAAGGPAIYSDSQCVANLLKRKKRLTADGFISKKTGQMLGNALLYRRFYELHDESGFQVVKLKGHSPARTHDNVQRVFSFVDKEARKALKTWLKESARGPGPTDTGPWCVYVLRCSNDAFYIGMTNNLDKRIEKHKLGIGSKFVRSWRPFELVRTMPCKDAGEARRLESNLKKLTRKKKIELLDL